MNLGHVAFPVVFAGEPLASLSGVVTSLDGAVELLLLLVPVIDVSLKMGLGSESLSTVGVCAFVLLSVVSLMMPDAC